MFRVNFQASINKKTTLIVGDGETVKIKTAKEKGIDILSVEDFKKKMEE